MYYDFHTHLDMYDRIEPVLNAKKVIIHWYSGPVDI